MIGEPDGGLHAGDAASDPASAPSATPPRPEAKAGRAPCAEVREGLAAATLVATAVAFVQPAAPRHLIKLRAGDELPEVSPGEVDWDEEFKRLKRGEVGKAAKLNEVGLEVERTGRVAKRKASDAARSVQRGAARAANSMPRAPSLSKDAVFWFAVIAALAFLPTLISVLSGPVASGPGGVYV